jgi:hypothetical protein
MVIINSQVAELSQLGWFVILKTENEYQAYGK